MLLPLVFKLALFPFHLWVANVYDGLPYKILLYFAIFPKLTIILWLPNLLISLSISLIIALIALIIGSLSLLFQYRFKRLIAYSSIANLALSFIALSLGAFDGYLYLIFIYLASNLLIFILIAQGFSDSQMILSDTLPNRWLYYLLSI